MRDQSQTTELLASFERALDEGAEAQRRTLVSVTREIDEVDPASMAFASRLASDRWWCWEQPDRAGFAIAALGTAHEIVSRGETRFADVARQCADLVQGAVVEQPAAAPLGSGPLFTGGFAFAAGGGGTPPWSSLPPGLMVLPELSLARSGGRSLLTLNAVVSGPNSVERAVEHAKRRFAALRDPGIAPLDPHRTGRVEITAPHHPGHYEEIVAAATGRIDAGELDKVVLARELVVEAPSAYDPGPVFGALRELFPACFCFCCGTPEAAFIGASPELLVRRSGAGAATVALAGSARRSADPAVDDHLGEQLVRSDKDRREHAIVVERIERSLRPHSVWVEAEGEPGLAKVANVQHLATPIHAQLAEAHAAVEIAGLLHPTPAVGGEPREAAAELIDELEGIDRGWYAGPVGWMDATEDGEFCVGLRSALLRDRTAHLYAGCGIVADSDPAAELAEAELKLDALLPILTA